MLNPSLPTRELPAATFSGSRTRWQQHVLHFGQTSHLTSAAQSWLRARSCAHRSRSESPAAALSLRMQEGTRSPRESERFLDFLCGGITNRYTVTFSRIVFADHDDEPVFPKTIETRYQPGRLPPTRLVQNAPWHRRVVQHLRRTAATLPVVCCFPKGFGRDQPSSRILIFRPERSVFAKKEKKKAGNQRNNLIAILLNLKQLISPKKAGTFMCVEI